MLHDIPWLLLEEHFANPTDSDAAQSVNEWVADASENRMILEQLQRYYKAYGSLPIDLKPDHQAALKKVIKKLDLKPQRHRLATSWWKVAALLIIGFTSWWLMYDMHQKPAPVEMSQLYAGNTKLNVTLSDGSHIWLNAHSSISYPKKFTNTRNIRLCGEAYFEIAHDSSRPFIVQTDQTKIRVLGTKFNVRSYPSEKEVIVTVTEGKVGFGSAANRQLLLTQNQKGTFDKQTGNIMQRENDNVNFMAWKTLVFQFDRQPLYKILSTLSEVYHFTYRIESPKNRNRTLTASFDQRPLSEIMQTIALSTNVQISLENGIYLIK